MRYVSAVLGFVGYLALSAALLFPAEAPHVFTPAQKSYWALQPVKKSPVPAVKNKAWVKTPIDAFILAKLEEKSLQPNPRRRQAHTAAPRHHRHDRPSSHAGGDPSSS